MVRRKPQQRCSSEGQHTHLGVNVEGCDTEIGTSINIDLRTGPPTYPRIDEPVIALDKALKIYGVAHYLEERAGERFVVSLVAGSRYEREMGQRLKAIQARDEHGSPCYRGHRGYDYPVFDVPTGMG